MGPSSAAAFILGALELLGVPMLGLLAKVAGVETLVANRPELVDFVGLEPKPARLVGAQASHFEAAHRIGAGGSASAMSSTKSA